VQVWLLSTEGEVLVMFDCPQNRSLRILVATLDHTFAARRPHQGRVGEVANPDHQDMNLHVDDDIIVAVSLVQVREMVGVRFRSSG
jgi:hypothetical protein